MDDHDRPFLAKLRIRKPKENRAKEVKQYKQGVLKERDTITDLQQCRQGKLQDIVDHEDCNVDSMWNNSKKCAMNAAKEVLAQKMLYRGDKKRTPWWGEEVKHSVRLKMEQFRKRMKSRSTEDHRNYAMARNEAQRVKRGAKRKPGGELEKT